MHVVLLLVLLVVWCVGPLLLLAKFAITPTQDILRTPMAIFPNGIAWSNLTRRGTTSTSASTSSTPSCSRPGRGLRQILVATTGGYVLSVLRPRYASVLQAARAGHAVRPGGRAAGPAVPDHPATRRWSTPRWSTPTGRVWLPAGASAFNVVLVARFFDNLPREVFEAARVDGAGPFRLFWSIVLPMSKPILGVVSVFAVIASWKDFLWPLLVLRNPDLQPLSVRLPSIEATTDKGVLMAALRHLDPHPDRAVPRLPAHVPARRRARRSGQGLTGRF